MQLIDPGNMQQSNCITFIGVRFYMYGNDQVVTSKESINYFGLLFMRVFKQCDMYFLELSGVASNT